LDQNRVQFGFIDPGNNHAVYQSVFYYYNAERRFVGFEMTRNIQQAAEVEIAHALGASIHAFRLQVPDMLEQLTRA
jgi:hypothetical protein